MTEDIACQRILAEMVALGIIDKEKEDAAWPYLIRIFGLGHDEGNAQPSKRKPVAQYRTDGKIVKIWPSMKAAANFYKITPQAINGVIKGRWRTAAGYKWELVNKE